MNSSKSRAYPTTSRAPIGNISFGLVSSFIKLEECSSPTWQLPCRRVPTAKKSPKHFRNLEHRKRCYTFHSSLCQPFTQKPRTDLRKHTSMSNETPSFQRFYQKITAHIPTDTHTSVQTHTHMAVSKDCSPPFPGTEHQTTHHRQKSSKQASRQAQAGRQPIIHHHPAGKYANFMFCVRATYISPFSIRSFSFCRPKC